MDIEDIDSWYDDKKEAITAAYHKKLKKADEDFAKKLLNTKKEDKDAVYKELNQKHDSLKKEYDRNMDRLHSDYDKKIKEKLKSNLKLHFMRHRIRLWKRKHFKFWYDLLDERKYRKQKKEK